MKLTIIFIVSSLMGAMLLLYCASPQQAYMEKGLVEGEPGTNLFHSGDPGTTIPLERPYDIAPPLIPHNIDDFQITRSTNDCMECHLDGFEVEEGHVATKIPPSHYTGADSSKTTAKNIIGARYNCLQCHVVQADVGKNSGREDEKK